MPSHWIISSACALAWLSAGAQAASLNHTDRQFLVMAARTDMTEAHEGQMAQNQAGSAGAKDLGKALVQDHTQSYAELTALAAKTGVSIPKGINTGKDHTITQLTHLNGARFDRQFATDQVVAQRRVLAEYKREAHHAQDPGVKAYAAKMVPIAEKHLQLAQQCAKPAKHT
jgi:putative membrane protein